MIQVAKEDVLRGLKKFKRLAKQDLLASDLMSDPEFWRVQAESRRRKYSELMESVKEKGVDMAYEIASQEYASLPLSDPAKADTPEVKGTQQALEMFFTLLGLGEKAMAALRQSSEMSHGGNDVAVGLNS